MTQPEPIKDYAKVQVKYDAETARILELTAKRIRARIARAGMGIGGQIRKAQLTATLNAVVTMLNAMWATIDATLDAGVDAGTEAAEDAIEAMTRVAYAALSPQVAETLVNGLRASAESGLKSDKARRKRELSERVYNQRDLSKGKVEETIRAGLISNLSARELAADVYGYVSPTTPGGASYAAMRLARTEINNAFHERQLEGAKRPGVSAVKWNLSGSHRVPDECNVYAAHNGDGVWPVDGVPEKPHPQCFCYLTYETMKSDDFIKALESGDFDDEIDRRTKLNMARLGQPVGDTPVPRKLSIVPSPPIAAQGRSVPSVDKIAASVKSGIVSSEKLTGGVSAETSKVKFKDGTTGVRKFIDNNTAKRQQDAEELVPLLARMMGINAPEVVRVDEKTTVQQFLPGNVAMHAVPRLINPGTPQAKILSPTTRAKPFVESDTGWLMAVLDQITGNQDRHDGNWLVNDDATEITAIIDHGLAYHIRDWRTKRHETLPLTDSYIFRTKSEFTKKFAKADGQQTKVDFHPDDLDAIQEMLSALRAEYVARDRLDWWEFSMKQIEALRPFATGKKRRIK